VKIWSEIPDQPTTLACWHENLNSSSPELLRNSCHLSQKSNIWRYELLEHFGGLYLDTDFEPIRCLEPLMNGLETFAGRCHVVDSPDTMIEGSLPACPGLIGCIPHHPWLKDLVENMATQDPRISRSLGASYFAEITSRHPEVHLVEPDVFYSQRWEQPAHYKPPIPDSAYAVHRWSSKWFPGGFNHSPTPGT
jgi:mannosyltransferase OCH1-like enzyme